MSAVNKVNFLLQAAAIFPPNGHVNQLLKSHYLATGRQVAEKNVNLPKKEFGETRMCQKCSSVWLDGNLKLKINSKKLKRQNKLITRTEAGDVLTRKQRAKAKWLSKNAKSRVDITCLLCKHKTKIHLDKPKYRNDSTPLQSTAASTTSTQDTLDASSSQKKPSKKKKKDKFAGLNPNLVAQASTSSSSSGSYNSTSNALAIINSTPSTSKNATNQSPTCSAKPPSFAGTSTNARLISEKKILPVVSHSLSKKAKRKAGPILQNPPKQVSKTQQKNTLLQLAQLLKTGASLTSKRSNPLENLLR